MWKEWQVPVLNCVFTFVSCYFSLKFLLSNAETYTVLSTITKSVEIKKKIKRK
jgi:hypothetical protein